ncbi:MAG: hypothetical protein B6D61_10315 [Bacteroidetes bacterium 4484_249]|nr:MAG: hypothetical protein B6D61_10315 [Bacteroidetes bacterium 4484_249]
MSFIVAGNGKSDEMVVYFRDDATNEFDSQFDAWKLFAMGMETPNLYSVSNGNKLAVNVLPFDNNVIPAGFKAGVNGVYTISVNDLENIGDDIIVYLEDLKENQMINLSELLSYSFTASVSDDPNRFLLHFGYFTGNNEFTNTENINIFAYDKTIYIKSGELLSGEAIIYDLTGKEILRKSINQSDFEKINVSNLSGYYLVSFVSNESIVNQKVFIK